MMEESQGLTLIGLWNLVRRNPKFMLVCAVAGLILGASVVFLNLSAYITSPSYTASMSLAIVSENTIGGFDHNYEYAGEEDVSAARNMTQTAAYICEGDQVINAAIKQMGLIGVSSKDVAEGLEATALSDSQIIVLTLTWDNPDEAVEILSAIADVVPGVLIETLKLGNASIVDSPKIVDDGQGLIRQLMFPLVGLLLGAFLALSFLVLKDILRPTVVDPSAVRSQFGLSLAGTVPDNPQIAKSCQSVLSGAPSLSELSFQESFMTTAHILSHYLRSAGATKGGAAEEGGRPHIVYLTSTLEEEGKSTCAARLAVELSKEWNVLLVDCDLSNPSLAPQFMNSLDPLRSINGVLNKGARLEDAIHHVAEGLHVLPSLVEHDRLAMTSKVVDLVEQASQGYDVVLIDTPPVGQTSEAMAFNRLADGVLFVIRYDYATKRSIDVSFDVLRQSGAEVLGIVMNRVNLRYFGELMRYPRYGSSRYAATGSLAPTQTNKPKRGLHARGRKG